jgi:hypothetical protein
MQWLLDIEQERVYMGEICGNKRFVMCQKLPRLYGKGTPQPLLGVGEEIFGLRFPTFQP